MNEIELCQEIYDSLRRSQDTQFNAEMVSMSRVSQDVISVELYDGTQFQIVVSLTKKREE